MNTTIQHHPITDQPRAAALRPEALDAVQTIHDIVRTWAPESEYTLTENSAEFPVLFGRCTLSVTPIGFKILTVLMRASPAVVRRGDLERQVWGNILPDSDTLRSHIYNLRKIIDKPFDRQLVHTIQGSGYKIVDSDAENQRPDQ